MRPRLRGLLAVGLGAWLLVCCKNKPELGRQLEGAEIQSLFADKTVKGHHDRHGYDFESYYEPTGRFRSHQGDKAKPRGARWWVSGQDICIRWDDTPEDLCRRMFVAADGTYRKVKVTPGGKRIVVVTFKSFTKGKSSGL